MNERQPRNALFLTGQLASGPLRSVLSGMKPAFGYDVQELAITVAAFLSVDWIIPRLSAEGDYDLIMVPGWCQGDLARLEDATGARAVRRPKDLLDIPRWFGSQEERPSLDAYDTKILA